MTVREWCHKQLVDRGLFPDQAAAVVLAFAETAAGTSMDGRWSDDTEGYPEPLFAVLLLSLSSEAVRWIDANKPQHWARAMFAAAAGQPTCETCGAVWVGGICDHREACPHYLPRTDKGRPYAARD